MYKPFTTNTSINIENITKGYVNTDEEKIKITEECTFIVYYNTLRFGVEAHHVDNDSDMYSISIYNQSAEKDRYRREDDNEICHCYLDSTGGGCMDEEICIVDHEGTRYKEVENVIMEVLFGENPLVIPF